MAQPAIELEPFEGADMDFRPVHYLGNKTRVLGLLHELVTSLVPTGAVVGDPFSGSGVVARRLSSTHRVFAADIQEYSRVLTSALLTPHPLTASEHANVLASAEDAYADLRAQAVGRLADHEQAALREAVLSRVESLAEVIEHGSMFVARAEAPHGKSPFGELLLEAGAELPMHADSVMTHVYAGPYFSYEQALRLDAIRRVIRQLPEHQQDTALAALLGAASETVSTVGNQFAQPMRACTKDGSPKVSALRNTSRKRQLDPRQAFSKYLRKYATLPTASVNPQILRGDYRTTLRQAPDDLALVYADPPYTRDHYSRFYHVLETLALGDSPEISGVERNGRAVPSRALYRRDRHQSPFCIKSQVMNAFSDLFELTAARQIPLILSYSPYVGGSAARPQPRLVTVEKLTELAAGHFSNVRVYTAGQLAHSKFNRSGLNIEASTEAEIFLVARP